MRRKREQVKNQEAPETVKRGEEKRGGTHFGNWKFSEIVGKAEKGAIFQRSRPVIWSEKGRGIFRRRPPLQVETSPLRFPCDSSSKPSAEFCMVGDSPRPLPPPPSLYERPVFICWSPKRRERDVVLSIRHGGCDKARGAAPHPPKGRSMYETFFDLVCGRSMYATLTCFAEGVCTQLSCTCARYGSELLPFCFAFPPPPLTTGHF